MLFTIKTQTHSHTVKLTQSQRADMLAKFFAAKAMACIPVSEKMEAAKQMLQAYEDELASWPEPAHAVKERARAMDYVSDVPVPLTEEQAQKLKKLPPPAPEG